MGTYKVPQNVEAEDKILGPLSLKQFIYALIGLGYGFLTFAILKPVLVLWFIVGVPPTLFMLGLGLYQREDQPLETFVVAIAQYFVRPKQRFWRKEPIAEVFRLEPPPPKPEPVKRDPRQVQSQLQRLAELVDTRGWSVKEPELQEPEEAPVVDLKGRIGGETLGQSPAITTAPTVTEEDDILNTDSAAAQNLNVLIENSVKSIRAEAVEKMRTPAVAPMPAAATTTAALGAPTPPAVAPAATTPAPTPTATGVPTPVTGAPLPTAPPAGGASGGVPDQDAAPARTDGVPTATGPAAPAAATISGSTASPSDDILKLATEGGDLTVSQIAAQARKHTALLAEGQSVSLRNATTT